MLVPFGTHVRDRDGKSVGTVSRIVLHPESRQVVALVAQQGILDRREIVLPLGTVARLDNGEIQLSLTARELGGFDLYNVPKLRPMPDHWPMPAGFDERAFFLVPDAWTAAMLPFQLTSSAAAGTPAWIPHHDAPEHRPDPAIAPSTAVYDSTGGRVGEVEAVDVDPATRRVTRLVVRRGRLFRTETTVPAGMVASVTDDRITLRAPTTELRRLDRGLTPRIGRAPAA
jgi:sporulation protein YlmC with PRC-barrel domain